jgi:hypothetical protein
MSQVLLECEKLGDFKRVIDNAKLTLCLSLLQGRHGNIRNEWYATLPVPLFHHRIYTRTFTLMSIPR